MVVGAAEQYKFQMVLPEALGVRLRTVAARQRIPLARFIRETMEQRLNEMEMETRRPALFQRLSGLGGNVPETDLSERADDILYGDYGDAAETE